MKNNIITILIVLIGHLLASQFMPWWNVAIVALITSFFFQKSALKAFWICFVTILFLWFGYILFLDIANESILSNQLKRMFALNSKWLVFIVSSFWGAVIAGFGGAIGTQLRNLFSKNKSETIINEENTHIDDLDKLRPEWKNTQHL